MKKLGVALILAMAVSLSACGASAATETSVAEETDVKVQNTENESEKETDQVIGTWKRHFTTDDGESVWQIIDIYEGGTGLFTIKHDNGDSDNEYKSTWELSGEILNITYSGRTMGYKLESTDGTATLTRVDDDTATFKKQ